MKRVTKKKKVWRKFKQTYGSTDYQAFYMRDGKRVKVKFVPIKLPIKFEMNLPPNKRPNPTQ